MEPIYFTVTGVNFRFGDPKEYAEKGTVLQLVKEPDNEFDSEAIMVMMPALGKIGYVSNSVKTRLGETSSAGRIYDKFGDKAEGKVLYLFPNGIICELIVRDDQKKD